MVWKIGVSLALLFLPVLANEPFERDSSSAAESIQQAPLRVSKAEWKKGKLQMLRFENPRELEDDKLWSLLDWAGGEAAWMEVDFGGYLPAFLSKVATGSRQAWYRQAPGAVTLVATLRGKVSATLEFRVVEPTPEPVQPLVCRYQGDSQVFRDFSARNSELCALSKNEKCLFVHAEDSRLTAEATAKTINMVMRAPDAEPFPVVTHFSQLSESQQTESVEEYRSYFQHEFNMAVRSFIETTPGLFNWQTWHWMQWGPEKLISRKEIKALLESEQRPGRIHIFQSTCKDGRKVRIWSDGQGTMGMVLQ